MAPQLIDDIDDTRAADFLVRRHVPFVGPEIGMELLKIIRRLEVVEKVYPLSDTLKAYKLALTLVVQVASKHQQAFCTMVEGVLNEPD